MITFSIPGQKGHLSLRAHGDDAKIHITAFRRQGKHFSPNTVKVGEFSIEIEALAEFVKGCRLLEAQRRGERKLDENPESR